MWRAIPPARAPAGNPHLGRRRTGAPRRPRARRAVGAAAAHKAAVDGAGNRGKVRARAGDRPAAPRPHGRARARGATPQVVAPTPHVLSRDRQRRGHPLPGSAGPRAGGRGARVPFHARAAHHRDQRARRLGRRPRLVVGVLRRGGGPDGERGCGARPPARGGRELPAPVAPATSRAERGRAARQPLGHDPLGPAGAARPAAADGPLRRRGGAGSARGRPRPGHGRAPAPLRAGAPGGCRLCPRPHPRAGGGRARALGELGGHVHQAPLQEARHPPARHVGDAAGRGAWQSPPP